MSAEVVRVGYRVSDEMRADVEPELLERFLCDAAAARVVSGGGTVTAQSVHGVVWHRIPADPMHDTPAMWLAKVGLTAETPAAAACAWAVICSVDHAAPVLPVETGDTENG